MAAPADIAINHVAISVPDLHAAVQWYKGVFGFTEIIPDGTFDDGEDPNGVIFKIYGNQLHRVKVAFLSASNRVGFELFEFVDPKYNGGTARSPTPFDPRAWTSGGFFHIAVTAADPKGLAAKAVEAGGSMVGEPIVMPSNEQAVYVQDPWGNAVEICSADFETVLKGR